MKTTTNILYCLHLTRVFLLVNMLVLLILSGCNKNEPSSTKYPNNNPDPTDPRVVRPTEVHYESGLYVGITSFGEYVDFYKSVENASDRYNILSNSTVDDFINFVNNLKISDATVLYYAVDNNLDYLTKCKFPHNLSSVNIITFTDGLNQGSRALDKQDGNHDYASNDIDYVNAVSTKLKTLNVQGLPINAYTIGLRGNDVQGDAVSTFKDNLVKLSSCPENAIEVSNMNEVNDKFKDIAKSLYKESLISIMRIEIPMPSEGEIERFTFDNVYDASQSKCYIEGVYAGGELSNVVYVGCSSTTGSSVIEESTNGVRISFEFMSLVDNGGNLVGTDKMQQWHKSNISSTWVRNSEFNPQESTSINVEKRNSAVVMLLLDCSSSLGVSDFFYLKEAARNFILNFVEKIPIKSVSLGDPYTTIYLGAGEKKQLWFEVSPPYATYKYVRWESSNNKVATVSSDGLVTRKGYGSATITVTVDGVGAYRRISCP